MPLSLYMNHNVPWAITESLRLRGVDVLTAYEDGSHLLADPDLLDRAGSLGRVLFTMDEDLLQVTTSRHRSGLSFEGLVYVHQRRALIGRCVEDLELLAMASTPGDLRGQIVYLPL